MAVRMMLINGKEHVSPPLVLSSPPLVHSVSRNHQGMAGKGAIIGQSPSPSITELEGVFGTESLISSQSPIPEVKVPPLFCQCSSKPFSVRSSKK